MVISEPINRTVKPHLCHSCLRQMITVLLGVQKRVQTKKIMLKYKIYTVYAISFSLITSFHVSKGFCIS